MLMADDITQRSAAPSAVIFGTVITVGRTWFHTGCRAKACGEVSGREGDTQAERLQGNDERIHQHREADA
jgi:hypothetical protein